MMYVLTKQPFLPLNYLEIAYLNLKKNNEHAEIKLEKEITGKTWVFQTKFS